jgi:hypothetical protein
MARTSEYDNYGLGFSAKKRFDEEEPGEDVEKDEELFDEEEEEFDEEYLESMEELKEEEDWEDE